MPTLRPLFALVLAGLLATSTSAAEVNPRDVAGRIEDGRLIVHWEPPEGDAIIASYRLYYATTSMIESEGAYDDFEIVPGDTHEYIFPEVPRSDALYVSVIPVDGDSNELTTFANEVRIALRSDAEATPDTPEPAVAAEAISAPADSDWIQALMANDLKVVVQFKAGISVAEADAPEAFAIHTLTGTPVSLRQLSIIGDTVTIDAAGLTPGASYVLKVNDTVRGEDDVAVGPLEREFQVPPVAQARQPLSAAAGEVRNLTLEYVRESDGRYLVTANWGRPYPDVQGYLIAQTYNEGRTFTKEVEVSGEALVARFPRVWGGSVGIRVRVIAPDGTVSRGTAKAIRLPGSTTRGNALNQTGPAAIAALCVAAGGGAGAWRMRRRRKTSAEA